ncbi:MAG: ferrous iron transport protein A [Planctomycetes bacterium]|nr:ferrous iron transport protein A [Planctomycetota bacterium]
MISDSASSQTPEPQPASQGKADEKLRVCQLSDLRAGECAHMQYADLQCDECDLLHALGMTDRCKLSVRKTGNPCIVQVGATRIGLAQSVSSKITVIPDDANGTVTRVSPSPQQQQQQQQQQQPGDEQ